MKLYPKLPKLYGWDGEGSPQFTTTDIGFNGNAKKGEDHETFHIPLIYNRERDLHPEEPFKFAFCKTAQKPYDLAVTVALLVFKHHLGPDLRVSSDGDLPDWEEAIKLVNDVLGYGSEWAFDLESDGGIVENPKAKASA